MTDFELNAVIGNDSNDTFMVLYRKRPCGVVSEYFNDIEDIIERLNILLNDSEIDSVKVFYNATADELFHYYK